MGISEVSNTTGNFTIKEAAKDNPLSLKKAIKAFKDEWLTGLTEEEKEEIERKIKEFLKSNPLKTQQDKDILNNYVKSLLKEYGFKGDIDEYAATLAAETGGESQSENEQPSQPSIMTHYQKAAMGAAAARYKLLT